MTDPAGLPPFQPRLSALDVRDAAGGTAGHVGALGVPGATATDWLGAFPAGERPAILGAPSGAVPAGVEEAAARVLARLGAAR